jgi:hypothetical protein
MGVCVCVWYEHVNHKPWKTSLSGLYWKQETIIEKIVDVV